jgi:signal recognition particle subunit SEC65
MAESFTAADHADCAEREVHQRQRAYPRWVEAGRMTQQLADRQTALMQAIARKLRAEADAEGAKGDLCGGEVRP